MLDYKTAQDGLQVENAAQVEKHIYSNCGSQPMQTEVMQLLGCEPTH